jgi:hypothetical protein
MVISFAIGLAISCNLISSQGQSIDAISFADSKDVYVAARVIAEKVGMHVEYDVATKHLLLNRTPLTISKRLFDGTALVNVSELESLGFSVAWNQLHDVASVTCENSAVEIRFAPKRVEIDLSSQRLRAYQGNWMVFDTNISSGKSGKSTPVGSFIVGPTKQLMHRSQLYNNAPMPYSVQVNGNIFIHGFSSVPNRPASHGCIRMPIPAAKWFYSWVEIGTSVEITGTWTGTIAKKIDGQTNSA